MTVKMRVLLIMIIFYSTKIKFKENYGTSTNGKMEDMHLALFLLVITNKSSGDCKTSIRRQKDGQKKVGKLETLGPKSDKIVSSWGFLLASDVPDLELTKPEMSENADKKSLFSLAKGPGNGQLRKIDTLQKITASVWQNIK